MGRGLVFRGQSRPHPKVAEPELSPILGFPSIYAYKICRRTTKFDVVTGNTWEKAVYLGISHTYNPKRTELQRSPIFGVLRYFCLHPLTQNNQIRYVTLCAGFGVVRIDPFRFLTSVYTFLPFLSHSFNSNWTVTIYSSIVYTYSILLSDCIRFYYTLFYYLIFSCSATFAASMSINVQFSSDVVKGD